MKNGFTLIELMIVVVIVILLAGGGIVYLNRFNAVQKVETTKDQLITNLRYARNYAITRQGSDGDLKYVSANLTIDGLLTVIPYSCCPVAIGTSFFSKDISSNGGVITTPIVCWFAAADGKLVGEENMEGAIVPVEVGGSIVPMSVGVSVVITTGEVGESRVVEINASGLINER